LVVKLLLLLLTITGAPLMSLHRCTHCCGRRNRNRRLVRIRRDDATTTRTRTQPSAHPVVFHIFIRQVHPRQRRAANTVSMAVFVRGRGDVLGVKVAVEFVLVASPTKNEPDKEDN
jgi:hypothetical protein